MTTRNAILAALLVTTMTVPAVIALPAQAGIDVDINLGPPEPIYEPIPAPRPGYIWSTGFWEWDGGYRHWHPGYWQPERPGYRWAPDRWEHYDNGWHLARGHYYAGPRGQEIRADKHEIRDDRHELRQDVREGDRQEFREDLHDYRDDKRDLRHDNGRANGHGPHDWH